MDVSISEDVIDNFILDCCKKDINPVDKAQIIRARMNSLKIDSAREFARKYNIAHSTLQEWLAFEKLNRKEYEQMLNKGFSKTQITKALRVDKKESLANPFDTLIKNMTTTLSDYIRHKPEITSETSLLLYGLKATITKLENSLK